MPSETDLLNDALGQIGADRITAIDDGSINANHCLVFYPSLRDALLRMHHWNFAEKRVELAQEAVKPQFEFTFSYVLPPDLLKLKEYNGSLVVVNEADLQFFVMPGKFKIEGRRLFTNDGEVKIVYVARVTDANQFDALFYQTLAVWLASKLARAITKDFRLSQQLVQEAIALFLPLAAAVDGQEGSVHPFIVDDLLWGR